MYPLDVNFLDSLRDVARRLTGSTSADFLEIRLEESKSLDVVYQGRNLSNNSPFIETGGFVRALINGSWGTCSFTEPDRIVHAAETAVRLASTVNDRGGITLPSMKPEHDLFYPPSIEGLADVPMREKVFLCRRYCDLLGASGKDVSAMVHYSETSRTKSVINSIGTDILEGESLCGIRLEAAGGSWNIRVSRNLAHRGGFEFIRHRENIIEEMAAEIATLGTAETVKPGLTPTVLDPELAGILIHEAFGHLSEADFQEENPLIKDVLPRGKRVASEIVTIVDDATHYRCPGSCAWDDEGTRGRRTVLVSKGMIVDRLHSIETAGCAGEQLTGNGRAGSFSASPDPRMTCTYCEPGQGSMDDLLHRMGSGLYLRGALGGATDMDNFTFTSCSAWTVRKGKLSRPLSPVTISGKVFDVLGSVVGLADDLRLCSGIGGCSKRGHRYLPVSYGGPHMFLRSMQVG